MTELTKRLAAGECNDSGWTVYPDTPCPRCHAIGEIAHKYCRGQDT